MTRSVRRRGDPSDTGPCPRLARLPEGTTINGVKLLLISLICFNNFIQKGRDEFPLPVSERSPAATGLSSSWGHLRRMPNWPGVPPARTKACKPSLTK